MKILNTTISVIILFVFSGVFCGPQVYAQKMLPDAELANFRTGEIINTHDLRGKVVYLDFWASWCIPCKKSFPFMNEIYQHYPKEHLAVIAINMDKSTEDAMTFLQEVPANFDIYTNTDNSLVTALDLPGLPVAFLVDRKGEIKARHIGFNERKKAKKVKQLQYLLGQNFTVDGQ